MDRGAAKFSAAACAPMPISRAAQAILARRVALPNKALPDRRAIAPRASESIHRIA
jgi:hypothetical protein